jgi:RecA-family ATPase
MEYEVNKREIIVNRKLNKLDRLVLSFIKILKKHVDYVIISGYVSILLGRSRATEDVDLFIKEIPFDTFLRLYEELVDGGFWCLNAEKPEEIFSYLTSKYAVRFSRKNDSIPNFELKFPKRQVDEETFEDFIIAILPKGKIKISSLERQIAFKKYYLQSDKDIEDALHIEESFKGKIDYEKVNKFKRIIDSIKENERREIG